MQLMPSLQHATILKLCCAPSTFLKPCTTTGQLSAINTLVRISRPYQNLHSPLQIIRADANRCSFRAAFAGLATAQAAE
jgi:hypothetical protein